MTRGQTPQLKKAFLDAFRVCGNVTTACQQTSIDRKAIYRWREKDVTFEQSFKAAEVESVEHLEAEARRRAVDGWDEPVFGSLGQGLGTGEVGTIRKYSDTLLIFLLKGNAPEKYRERTNIEHSGRLGIDVRELSDDDLDARIAELAAAERDVAGAVGREESAPGTVESATGPADAGVP